MQRTTPISTTVRSALPADRPAAHELARRAAGSWGGGRAFQTDTLLNSASCALKRGSARRLRTQPRNCVSEHGPCVSFCARCPEPE